MRRMLLPGVTLLVILVLLVLLLSVLNKNQGLKQANERLILQADSLHIATLRIKKEKAYMQQLLDSLEKEQNRITAP